MGIRSWFRSFESAWRSVRNSGRLESPAPARFRPTVETLEERTVLSATSLAPATLATTRVSFLTPLEMHIHVELHIVIDNQALTIPANIGVGQNDATLIHTHDTTGLIHVESPFVHDYFLEDFFYIWSQVSTEGHQVQQEIDSARNLVITVNGTAAALDGLVLHDHDTINVQVTTANDLFITQVFRDLLHRDPDPDGLSHFQAFLATGGSRDQLAQLIVGSTEYRTQQVEQLYHTLLQRDADTAGLNYFVNFLGSNGTIEQVEATILGSTEYYQLTGGIDLTWLEVIYAKVLGRSLDLGGAEYWQAALAGGTSKVQAAQEIQSSSEAEGDRLEGNFQLFLHRDVDDAGRSAFVAAMSNGMKDTQVIASIVASDEYFSNTGA